MGTVCLEDSGQFISMSGAEEDLSVLWATQPGTIGVADSTSQVQHIRAYREVSRMQRWSIGLKLMAGETE